PALQRGSEERRAPRPCAMSLRAGQFYAALVGILENFGFEDDPRRAARPSAMYEPHTTVHHLEERSTGSAETHWKGCYSGLTWIGCNSLLISVRSYSTPLSL